jgi:hypothetical protein
VMKISEEGVRELTGAMVKLPYLLRRNEKGINARFLCSGWLKGYFKIFYDGVEMFMLNASPAR